MTEQYVVSFFLLLLFSLLISRKASLLLWIPVPATLVLIGFIGSELWIGAGMDTGIRASNVDSIANNLILPIIIMYAMGRIPTGVVRRHIRLYSLLIIPGFLVTAAGAAYIAYAAIGHPSGFPIISALLFAVVACCTDNSGDHICVKPVQKTRHATFALEIEAIGLDVMAVILFTLFVHLHEMAATSAVQASWLVGQQLLWLTGALLAGAVVAKVLIKLASRDLSTLNQLTYFIVIGLSSFAVGQWLMQGYGVPACATAIYFWRNSLDKQARQNVLAYFSPIYIYAVAFMFLLLGITTTIDMFEERWLAMLIAIAAVLAARCFTLVAVYPLRRSNVLMKSPADITQTTMASGRGAFAVALVLTLPESVDGWWTIQAMVFAVVLANTFLQQPLLEWYLRRQTR